MALDDYPGLVETIVSYAFRAGDTDFIAAVPTFIRLAESRINRTLRVAEMETAATLTLTDGAATLPADFVAARRATSVRQPLALVTPGWASDNFSTNHGGAALYYTIIGSTLQTYPSDSGPISLTYYARVPALTEDEPTNWLLTKAPELYLYGALIEAAPFMMDDARIQGWMTLFLGALKDLKAEDSLGRYSPGAARVSGPTP